jgi:hypothetical protein
MKYTLSILCIISHNIHFLRNKSIYFKITITMAAMRNDFFWHADLER